MPETDKATQSDLPGFSNTIVNKPVETDLGIGPDGKHTKHIPTGLTREELNKLSNKRVGNKKKAVIGIDGWTNH